MKSPNLKPTTQLVKGSLFDTLGEVVGDEIFIDLFAGSGGMGIEALSRGAKRAVMVESDRQMLGVIRENLKTCRFGEEAEVRRENALEFLGRFIGESKFAHIIFADPPYSGDYCGKIIEMVGEGEQCPCRVLILEHRDGLKLEGRGKLDKWRTRAFGQTALSYFLCNDENR